MHVLNPSPETVEIPANFQKKALPDSGRVQSTSQGAWSRNWVCGRWFPEPKCGVHRRSSPAVAGWAPRPQVRITRPRKSRFSCPTKLHFFSHRNDEWIAIFRFVHDLYDSCEGGSKRYCCPSTRYDSRHGWYIVVFFIYHQAPSTKRFEFDSGADFFSFRFDKVKLETDFFACSSHNTWGLMKLPSSFPHTSSVILSNNANNT